MIYKVSFVLLIV